MFKLQNGNIRLQLDLKPDFYERFSQSKFRKDVNTDSEAVRACIKFAIDSTNLNITQINNNTPSSLQEN